MAVRRKHDYNGREPVCPNCGSDVTRLGYFRALSFEMGSVRLTEDGRFVIEREKHGSTGKDADFTCPICKKLICIDEKDTERFLRTGKHADEEDDSAE